MGFLRGGRRREISVAARFWRARENALIIMVMMMPGDPSRVTHTTVITAVERSPSRPRGMQFCEKIERTDNNEKKNRHGSYKILGN